MTVFVGPNLRLMRLFHGQSLADLGETVGVSKQFLSRIESGAQPVSQALEQALAEELEVEPDFFYLVDAMPIAEEQCHFRRQLTTKIALRQVARAKGEMLKRLVAVLDQHLDLPPYQMEEADPSSAESIENASELFRAKLGLGNGPLSNVTRVAENAGAVVLRIDGLAHEIDAISFATRRPLIALNNDGRSACRERFGVAHELGHFALHMGVLTGDRLTESQANRFASSLLLPRKAFASECTLATRGTRLNWSGLSELKVRWGASKAAILYRGRQLGVLTDDQMKAGFIRLKRHGEALQESEDALVKHEEPEVISDSLQLLNSQLGIPLAAVARRLRVKSSLLFKMLGRETTDNNIASPNVLNLFGEPHFS